MNKWYYAVVIGCLGFVAVKMVHLDNEVSLRATQTEALSTKTEEISKLMERVEVRMDEMTIAIDNLKASVEVLTNK